MSGCVRSYDSLPASLVLLTSIPGSSRRRGLNTSPLPRRDIGPQRLKLFGFEEIAPWRHLVLAARYRVEEAFVLVGWKFSQIECGAGILHVRAVTRRAVDGVELGTARDLVVCEALRFFGAGRHAHNETCQGDR